MINTRSILLISLILAVGLHHHQRLAVDAKPADSAAAPPVFDIEKVIEQAKTLVNDVAKQLPDSLKIDQKQATDFIQNTSSHLTSKINKILDDVSVELNKQAADANKVLSNVAENLKGIKENLEKQYPEASAKAKEIQAQLNDALNKMYEQGKVLAENVKGDLSNANEKLAEISKKVLDATIKTAEEIKKNVEESQKKN